MKTAKVYNYNIRCKICKKGFNPKNKQSTYSCICPACYSKKYQNNINYKD